MKILLLRDISSDTNPCDFQLLRGLTRHSGVEAIHHCAGWVRRPEVDVDVVHIQWPESIFNWREPAEPEFALLERALDRWAKDAVIISTIHNLHPHQEDTTTFRRLYNLVYTYTDGFIHLGNASKDIMRTRYCSVLEKAEEIVIPHGDYEWFTSDPILEKDRLKLGFQPDDQVVLSFGTLRIMDEYRLLMKGYGKVSIPQKRLVIAGRLPHQQRSTWQYYWERLPLHFRSDVVCYDRFIEHYEVSSIVNASDVVVIPRIEALNSGNVPLGFTFGKVVVGPEIGVIGEVLRNTGNPTFDPQKPSDMARALEKGMMLAHEGHGAFNQVYANKHWNWSTIADQHVKFYRQVIETKTKCV